MLSGSFSAVADVSYYQGMVSGNSAEMAAAVLLPFDAVYSENAAAVHRYCLAQAGSLVAAEDLAQETFAKALVAYRRAAPDALGVRPWLLAIARNVCVDHARRQWRWRRLVARMAAEPDPPAQISDDVERELNLDRVLQALRRCSPTERQLIGLRIAAGLPFREVAAVIAVPEAAAKTATYRALAKLRAIVEREQ